jgi:hypothetical protein
MTEPIDTNKYQVWFQDIDPDTGEICQTKLICIAINKTMANWVVSSLDTELIMKLEKQIETL